mmetsp:Transcript_72876/g.205353  ORF Transcript_72876/g.205353 Transcript_72876/m.205353 type:complete len:86 (+) Transcript_72876:66-323(+)
MSALMDMGVEMLQERKQHKNEAMRVSALSSKVQVSTMGLDGPSPPRLGLGLCSVFRAAPAMRSLTSSRGLRPIRELPDLLDDALM